MLCETCKKEFTDAEYKDHLFKIASKILCEKCHSDNIKAIISNSIMHSECVACGNRLI